MTVQGVDLAGLNAFFTSSRFSGPIFSGESRPSESTGVGEVTRKAGVPTLFAKMAESMTDQLRSGYSMTATGLAVESVIFVQVRWEWLSLPLFVVLAAAVQLVYTMVCCRSDPSPLRKSSIVAVLFHELSGGGQSKDVSSILSLGYPVNMSHGTGTKVLRKFGINESYQMAMYLIDQYRGTVLSCRYAIPPRLAPADSRTQLEQAIKVAVVDTILRHPMTQVGIKDITSKVPSWIQLQSLDLTQHIKWFYIEDHDDFEQTVQETFRTQLDERCWDLSTTQPSWKITIIRQGNAPVMEVLLTWNHPQFDGAGAKVFHEDFLQMLNTENSSNEREGLEVNLLRLPRKPPLLPVPIEKLKKLPVSPPQLGKAFWEEIRPQRLNWDKSLATWCPIRTSPYRTQYRAFFINNTALVAILALCRKNKTTITGLLNGLALIAFSSHLDSQAAPAFQSSTIVDHRRNLPPAPKGARWVTSDRVVANYVTQAFHRYGTRLVSRVRSKLQADAKGGILSADLQRELWIASARNRREIVDKLDAGLQNDLVGVFKYVKDWEKTMRDQARKTRQFSWLVTNIGVLDGNHVQQSTEGGDDDADDAQRWSIERAQFGLSAEVPAAAIEFAAVSVAGHGMCVSSNWADCAVDTNLGDRIMADLERWLNQIGNQS